MEALIRKKRAAAEGSAATVAAMQDLKQSVSNPTAFLEDSEDLPTKRARLPPEWREAQAAAPSPSGVVALTRLLSGDAPPRTPSGLAAGAGAVLHPSQFVKPSATSTTSVTALEVARAARRVIVLDVETTGFNADDEIVEIGAVEVLGLTEVGTAFSSVVRPVAKVSHPMALAVHKLDVELLAAAPTFAEVLPSFLDFVDLNASLWPCGGDEEAASSTTATASALLLVAHNATFDSRMLMSAVGRALKDPLLSAHVADPEWIRRLDCFCAALSRCACTLALMRAVYPPPGGAASRDLESCCHFLGICHLDCAARRAERHSAAADARIAAHVWIKLQSVITEACATQSSTTPLDPQRSLSFPPQNSSSHSDGSACC